MQAGLVFGQIGQTEYIVKNMIAESGYENVKVVATGGLGFQKRQTALIFMILN